MYTTEDIDKVSRVTKALIDTSAFMAVQSDFLGIRNHDILFFMNALKEKNIQLLSHQILEYELINHVKDSRIVKDLKSLHDSIIKSENIFHEDKSIMAILEKIKNYDLEKKMAEAYHDLYSQAVLLRYPDPNIVFSQYFCNKPPFKESGKKKSEFPDAFVIQAIRDYICQNDEETLLVVSADNDWKESFKDVDRVIYCESIGEAVGFVNKLNQYLSYDGIKEIIASLRNTLTKALVDELLWHEFCINGFIDLENIIVNYISINNIDEEVLPIMLTEDSLIVRLHVNFTAYGDAEEFDYDESIWDPEDKYYIVKKYKHIDFAGVSDIEVDVHIEYDRSDLKQSTIDRIDVLEDIIDLDVDGMTTYM